MKHELYHILEQELGSGTKTSKTNVKFYCPFCHHKKKKLEIDTNNEIWHCWVCNEKGRSVYSLLKKLNTHQNVLHSVHDLSDIKYIPQSKEIKTIETGLQLPENFIPLYYPIKNKTNTYKSVLQYLIKRNLTPIDVKRYKIGYCEKGKFKNRIIFPSFNSKNELNYYVGRVLPNKSKLAYLTPPISKDDIIPFENLINFNLDVYIAEGALDAIAMHYNTIPLFGKTIGKSLMQKLIKTQPPNIYIILDNDAIKQAVGLINKLKYNSVKSNIHLIELPENKDPSDIGFKNMFKLINNSRKFTQTDLMKFKLNYNI